MASTTTDRLAGVTAGLASKAPVRVATTANITLSGAQTIDAVAVVADDRVLVKNQTDGIENGVYDVKTGAWVRSLDFDGSRDVVSGTFVVVTSGSVGARTAWQISTSNPITIGTTSIAFVAAVWSSASGVDVIAAGSTTARSLADRFAEVYNVVDWMDSGDSDATTGFNLIVADINALAAASFPVAIYFPPGEQHVLSAALTAITNTAGWTSVIGEAMNASQVKLTGAAQIQFGDASNRLTYPTVQNITIGGQQTADAAVLFANCIRPQGINVNGHGSNGHIFQFGVSGADSCTGAKLLNVIIPVQGGSIDGIAKYIVPIGETSGDNQFSHCAIQGRAAATDGAFHFEIFGDMDGIAIFDLFTSTHANSIRFDLDGTGAGNGALANCIIQGGQFDKGGVDINVVSAGSINRLKAEISLSTGATFDANFDATSGFTEMVLDITGSGPTDSLVIIDNDSAGGTVGSVSGKVVCNAGGNVTTNTKDMVKLIGAFAVVDLDLIPLTSNSKQWKHAVQVTVDGPTFSKDSSIRVHGQDFGTAEADADGITNLLISNDVKGTWTPVLSFVTPGDLSVAYTNQLGWFEKIKNVIHYAFVITTSTFTHTTASGNLTVAGLPASSSNNAINRNHGKLSWGGITKAAYTDITCLVGQDVSLCVFQASGSGQVVSNVATGDMPTGGSVVLQGTGFYFID